MRNKYSHWLTNQINQHWSEETESLPDSLYKTQSLCGKTGTSWWLKGNIPQSYLYLIALNLYSTIYWLIIQIKTWERQPPRHRQEFSLWINTLAFLFSPLSYINWVTRHPSPYVWSIPVSDIGDFTKLHIISKFSYGFILLLPIDHFLNLGLFERFISIIQWKSNWD